MLQRRKLVFVISLLIIFFYGSVDLWAHPWPMFQRTNRHRGRALVVGPDSLDPAFAADIASISEGAPVVADDGTIYVGTQRGELRAFDSAGTLKWTYPTLGIIRSTPLIGPDGTVYVGSQDGGLYAVNPDGTLQWVFFIDKTDTLSSSPLLSNDKSILYFGSQAGKFYAVGIDGF